MESKQAEYSSTVFPLETISLSPTTSIPRKSNLARGGDIGRLVFQRSIEFYWGLQKYEIDIDSPLNTILAQPDIIEALRDEEYALLPNEETIREMKELTVANTKCPLESRRSCFEVFPEKEYEYALWPVMTTASLFIHSTSGIARSVASLEYPYPYFLRVSSRVHPFFVVQRSYASVNCLSFEYSTAKDALNLGFMWRRGGFPPEWRVEVASSQSKSESEFDSEYQTSRDESDCESDSDSSTHSPLQLASDFSDVGPGSYKSVLSWRATVAEYATDSALSDTDFI